MGGMCVCDSLRQHGHKVRCGHCTKSEDHMFEAHVTRPVNRPLATNLSDHEIKRQLYLLHASTGHGNVRNLIMALQRRGVGGRVMELAKQFECSICQENQRKQPHKVATLEPLPPKFSVVSVDEGKWTHPQTREEYIFLLGLDEGSRFRVGRIMKTGKHQTVSASHFVQFFEDNWIQYFGAPQVLRLDPAGPFRSHTIEQYCDQRGSPLADRGL